MLLKQQSHPISMNRLRKDGYRGDKDQHKDGHEDGRDYLSHRDVRDTMTFKDTSSHSHDGNMTFLSSATTATTTSKMTGSPMSHHQFRTPAPPSSSITPPLLELIFNTMLDTADSSAHSSPQVSHQALQHPQPVHVRRCSNDYTSDLRPSSNNTIPQAPASLHGGGGNNKKSFRRLPVIVPPLTSSGGIMKKNNTSTTTTSAPPASRSKIPPLTSRRSHLRRKSSTHSNVPL